MSIDRFKSVFITFHRNGFDFIFFWQDLQDWRDFFRLWQGVLRPKDRWKMEDRSAMTRDDRPNDPHSLKHRPFSLSPPENGGSSTLSFQLWAISSLSWWSCLPCEIFSVLISPGSNFLLEMRNHSYLCRIFFAFIIKFLYLHDNKKLLFILSCINEY